MPDFNKEKGKIVVSLREFTLLKKSDSIIDRFSEPYIISLAVDENGFGSDHRLDFNYLPFPNVMKNEKINIEGEGHIIYGPKNPGEFVAYSVLFVESDKDNRDFGKDLEKVAQSRFAESLVGLAGSMANPGFGVAAKLLFELTGVISGLLKNNKDDELFRLEGTLLRDWSNPYNIGESFKNANHFVNCKIDILGLT